MSSSSVSNRHWVSAVLVGFYELRRSLAKAVGRDREENVEQGQNAAAAAACRDAKTHNWHLHKEERTQRPLDVEGPASFTVTVAVFVAVVVIAVATATAIRQALAQAGRRSDRGSAATTPS